MSIATKRFQVPLGLFSPNLISQSACRILTTHTKQGPFCMMIGQLGWEKIGQTGLKNIWQLCFLDELRDGYGLYVEATHT